MKTVIARTLICSLVVAATPARADRTLPTYLILAESQVLEGDRVCVQTCFSDLDCGEGACTDSPVGRVCAENQSVEGWGACAEGSSSCRDDQICARTNNGLQALDDFVEHKRRRGFSVEVVTPPQVLLGTESTRDERALRLREWLRQRHEEGGLEYLLIIASPNDNNP